VAIPDPVAAGLARLGWLPGAPITWDQWQMLQRDNVVSDGATGFEAFGIAPAPLAAVAPTWLVRYRRHGRFSLTPA
jgi:NADH dehydrogenase